MSDTIPKPIYERIKQALLSREPSAVTLILPGDGTIKEGIITPVQIIPAK